MRSFLAFGAALVALGLITGPAVAETDYPTGTVTIIIPYGPGGGTDNMMRIVQPHLQETLGQTVVIENRPGGGSTIGTDEVVRAAPDGYTVLVTDSAILVNPALHDDLPYDTMADLEPVSLLASGPVVLVAHPDTEADSLEELAEIAAERPGELTFASGGHGTSPHLALELMQMEMDIEVIHVPYGGSGPATTDLVAGHVDYSFLGISGSKPHLEEGALKAIATTGEERHPAIPDVPTFAEEGYPDVNPMSYWGAWVPAGTPPEVQERLSEAFHEAVNHPDIADNLSELGFVTIGSSPEEYRELAESEMARWAEVVDVAGIEVD